MRRLMRLFLIVAGLFVLLIVCITIAQTTGILPKSTPTPEAQIATEPTPAQSGQAGEDQPTSTPKPTDPPKPTDTPKPTPTPQPSGLSRSNPASVGQPVVAGDQLEITVLGRTRGKEAADKIEGYNMFNSDPKEGMEYVLVQARVRFLGDTDKTKSVSAMDFRVVGDRGTIYNSPFMLVLANDLNVEIYGGGTAEGEIAFEVVNGEGGLVIIYDSGLGTTARYLAVE